VLLAVGLVIIREFVGFKVLRRILEGLNLKLCLFFALLIIVHYVLNQKGLLLLFVALVSLLSLTGVQGLRKF
jgi:hypothetical protein